MSSEFCWFKLYASKFTTRNLTRNASPVMSKRTLCCSSPTC